MKTAFITLLLCLLAGSGALAQTTTVPPPPIPESVFPLGGFEIGTLNGIKLDPGNSHSGTAGIDFLTLLSRNGFNTLYHADGPISGFNYMPNGTDYQVRLAQNMPSGMASYHGGEYFDFTHSFIGNFRDGVKGYEQCYSLACYTSSGSDFDYETPAPKISGPSGIPYDPGGLYSSNAVSGNGAAGALRNGEWVSKPGDVATADVDAFTVNTAGYTNNKYNTTLSTTDADNLFASQETADENFISYLNSNSDKTSSASVDFIYRLDGAERESSGALVSSDARDLFTVTAEVDHYDPDAHDNSRIAVPFTNCSVSAAINWAGYSSYINSQHRYESDHTLNFPRSTKQSYAVIHLTLPLPTGSISGHPFIKLQVRSKTISNIYIRGFRLRSYLANEVLTGLKDNVLINGSTNNDGSSNNNGINGIRNSLSGSKNTTALTCAGELPSTGYRVLAYIDNLYARRLGKHIYSFVATSTGNYGYYRAIYEDQNGVAPPVVMEENFDMYDYWGAPNPYQSGDAIPAKYLFPYTGAQFEDFGYLVASGYTGTASAPGYLQYTSNMQGDLTSTLALNFGRYDRASENYIRSANAAYSYPGDPLGRWNALISVITTMNFQFLFLSNALGVGTQTALMNALRTGSTATQASDAVSAFVLSGGGNYRELTYKGFTFNQLSQLSCDRSDPDGAHRYNLDQRGPTQSEIRADTWNAISFGAKGIYFNPIGSDGGGNVGMGDEAFNLYDGPTYGRGSAGENPGPFFLGVGNSCPDNTTGLHVNEALSSDVITSPHWDMRLVVWNGSGSPPNGLSKYQLIPLDAGGTGNDFQSRVDNYFGTSSNYSSLEVYISSPPSNALVSSISSFPSRFAAGSWKPVVYETDIDDKHLCSSDWAGWISNPDQTGFITSSTFDDMVHGNDLAPFIYQHGGAGDKSTGYPFQHLLIRPVIPTFYGFNDKWEGAKRSVADLLPIAGVLSRLKWGVTTNLALPNPPLYEIIPRRCDDHQDATKPIGWNNYKTDNSDWGSFPIMEDMEQVTRNNTMITEDHTSQKVRRYDYSGSLFVPRTDNDGGNDGSYSQFNASTDGRAFEDPGNLSQAAKLAAGKQFDQKFYQLGKFSDPTDPQALYFTVENRRTWPVRFSMNGTARSGILASDASTDVNGLTKTQNLLGAIDVRQFNFKLRWSIIHQQAGTQAYFSVTNMRSGLERIVADNDQSVFSVVLEPGEGTLWRITPARSFIAGRTDDAGMTFNNGERLADLSAGRKIMVWNKQGKVEYALINNPGLAGFNNYIPTSPNAETLLHDPNSSTIMDMNASVAAKFGENGAPDTVAVIWNESDAVNKTSRAVLFNWGVTQPSSGNIVISWQLSMPLTLDNVPYDMSEKELVTPVIASTLDGFFVAWSKPTPGIQPGYVEFRTVGTNFQAKLRTPALPLIRAEASASRCVFPTVATKDERQVFTSIMDPIQYDQIAWEEDYPDGNSEKSQIYYQPFSRAVPVDQLYTGAPIERVSKQMVSCHHHHPNISIGDPRKYVQTVGFPPVTDTFKIRGIPSVTWETELSDYICDDNLGAIDAPSVMVVVRQRYASPNFWSAFTSFYPKIGNRPLPLVKQGALVFQDSAAGEVHMRHAYGSLWLDHSKWESKKLIENGMYPNLSLPIKPGVIEDGSYTFRGTVRGDDGLYYAKITNQPYPTIETDEVSQLVTSLGASSPQQCELGLRYSAGGGSIGPPDQPEPRGLDTTARREINWRDKDLSIDGWTQPYEAADSNHASRSSTSYGWAITEDSVRTNNFVIHDGDNIHITTEAMLFDTASIRAMFSDTSHSVSFSLVLKDSATSQPLDVIDQFTLTGAQILNSFNLYQIRCPQRINWHSRNYAHLGSGTGYLTIIAQRDANTPLDLVQEQRYMADFSAPVPIDTSYKRADPTPSTSSVKLGLFVYPNPFNPSATVEFHSSAGVHAKVEVYDIIGRLRSTLFDADTPSEGMIRVKLDAASFTTGTYLVRAVSGNEVITRRVQLLK